LAPPVVVVALVAALAAALELPRDVAVLVALARRPLAPADRLLPATTWLPRVPLLAALLPVLLVLTRLRLVGLALLVVVVVLREARLEVEVVLVLVVAQLLLLSRQLSSAAMARSSPIPLLPTYKPGRSSR
jgi:hypothetical protein